MAVRRVSLASMLTSGGSSGLTCRPKTGLTAGGISGRSFSSTRTSAASREIVSPNRAAEAGRLEPDSVDYVTLANLANIGIPVMPNAQYWREQFKLLRRITRA